MEPGMFALLSTVLIRWLMGLAGYLSPTNTFPRPLSEKEEARYLHLWKKGDISARNTLVERNLRLVAHIIKKFENSNEDIEDLISIGTVGLIKAINTFDQSKGTRLATYAARCIENEILMHLRSIKKNRSEVSLYDPIGFDREGNEITLMETLGSDPDLVPDTVGQRLEEANLRKKIEQLEGKERQVLELRYGLGGRLRRTQREIAKMLGISRSYVSRIEKKAVNKLWREFSESIQLISR